MHLYSVLVPQYFEPLTYQSEDVIPEGSMVAVPLRTKTVRGIVLSRVDEAPVAPKNIAEIIAPSLLEKSHLEMIQKISEYYFCTKSQALKLFLPGGILRQKKMAAPTRRGAQKIGHSNGGAAAIKHLQPQQEAALHAILSSPKQKFLLHGVTGSGKTEVYLRLAQEIHSQGMDVIILVPEISLTPQLTEYFSAHFPDLAVWHSRLSDGEKRRAWWQIKETTPSIVLGSRSALFVPVRRPGLIVIDEEHEWTYKQENAPRYHARRVAEMMCDISPQMKLVLGSATPDVETYFHTHQAGKWRLLEMSERISHGSEAFSPVALPEVTVVDLRDEFRKRNFSIFSELLQEKIRQTLERQEQIILFLNRRGSASAIMCRECGFACQCRHCDIAMTLHGSEHSQMLLCHHCGSMGAPPIKCPQCHSVYLKQIGIGTQKVEIEAKTLFPHARILRADRDSTSKKTDFDRIYQAIKSHEADILIGTQMIAKGLDLPKVSLVGVILADVGLHIPDFRAGEKTFQLLTQVAGRAGRRETRGEVIIQTYVPEHPAIQAASRHDYAGFYREEITERETFGYPPHDAMVKLTCEHADKARCHEETKRIFEVLSDINSLNSCNTTLNMAPASIPKRLGKYRWHIYLAGKHPENLLNQVSLPRGWKVDRDPTAMG